MNIAQNIYSYYESKYFESNYFPMLVESFAYDKKEMIDRIICLFNVSNYETQKFLSNWKIIDREQAEKIHSFIEENIDSFVSRFSGYYVGYTSLNSVGFGEQEVQLAGIYNHKTKKEYSLKYLRKVFEKEGYCVNGNNYAYYDIQGGLHIDLLNTPESITLLNDFIATI